MGEKKDTTPKGEWSSTDGLALTLAYLEDPSSVPCPSCGADQVEVVDFVSPQSLGAGVPARTAPEGDYAVILFCHGCERAAAIRLRGTSDPGAREAA